MNIKDLAIKIKALIDSTDISGEREAAENMLAKLECKYGTVDFNAITMEKHKFKFHSSFEERLLLQLMYKIRGNHNFEVFNCRNSSTGRLSRTTIIFLCTEAESIEIQMLFDIYNTLYKNDLKLFQDAFIMKHDIFGEPSENIKKKEISREELMKLFALTEGMSNAVIPRALLTDKEISNEGETVSTL